MEETPTTAGEDPVTATIEKAQGQLAPAERFPIAQGQVLKISLLFLVEEEKNGVFHKCSLCSVIFILCSSMKGKGMHHSEARRLQAGPSFPSPKHSEGFGANAGLEWNERQQTPCIF